MDNNTKTRYTEGRWHTADNYSGESTLKQHLYIPATRQRGSFEPYQGNQTLCSRRGGIVDQNDKFVPIGKIKPEIASKNACKKCLKLVNNG